MKDEAFFKTLMSHSDAQITYSDPYVRETKMNVMSSFDGWQLHPMQYNEIKGYWQIDASVLKHGHQL